jgi:hypothetical protein
VWFPRAEDACSWHLREPNDDAHRETEDAARPSEDERAQHHPDEREHHELNESAEPSGLRVLGIPSKHEQRANGDERDRHTPADEYAEQHASADEAKPVHDHDSAEKPGASHRLLLIGLGAPALDDEDSAGFALHQKGEPVCADGGRRGLLKPRAHVADAFGVTKSAYYGYFVMWALAAAFIAFVFLAIVLDLSAIALSFAYFVAGGLLAVEGLLLITDWRGGTNFFTQLRSQADPSPAARFATWMPSWWPWSLGGTLRVYGSISVGCGSITLLLGLALLLS